MSAPVPPPPAAVDRYAVIGHPIAHSKSPLIHTRFAAQTGEALRYELLPAPPDGFVDAMRAFVDAGGRGLNVTVPFKLEAHALADALSPRADAAGAVNTLRVDADGRLYGDNTDGVGLRRDIEVNLGVALAGRRVLLLGAGGAARGVVPALLECRPAELAIVNRTATRASELAQRFDAAAQTACCRLFGGGPRSARGAFDVVINATAGSLDDALPEFDAAALTVGTLAYDMMYGARPTVFLQHAAARGAATADGLGMLVEQAAESFCVWRGVRPQTAAVLAELRASLK